MNEALREKVRQKVKEQRERPYRLVVTNTGEKARWASVGMYRQDGSLMSEMWVEV